MSGLVGWWPLHETEGDTAHDLSGNNNHGSLNGGITQGVAGRGGLSAYSFDGTNGYVNGDKSIEFKALSLWVRPNSKFDAGDDRGGILADSTEQFNYITLGNGFGDVNASLSVNHTDSGASSGIEDTIKPIWNHIVINYENRIYQIYLNSERKDLIKAEEGGKFSIGSWEIGARDVANEDYLNGLIGDVRAYNRVLTPQEIQRLYHMGSRDLHKKSLSDGSDSGAVSRWKLEDGGADGSTAIDTWGDNDGTINGASFTDNSVRNDGRALQFDGEEDYVRSNDVTDGLTAMSANSSNPFTVVMWAKLNSDVGGSAQLASFDSSETGEWFSFGMRNGSWDFYSDGRTPEEGDVAPTKDAWVQVVMEWDGEYLRLYENTEQVFQQNPDGDGTWIEDLDRFVFGAREINGDLSQHWLGVIDNISVFDRVLESWEVFELYRWGSLGKDMRKELVNAKGGDS